MLVPYFTTESDASSVLQLTLAELAVMLLVVGPAVIAGASVSIVAAVDACDDSDPAVALTRRGAVENGASDAVQGGGRR